MNIELNQSVIGNLNCSTNQVIAIAWQTDKRNPVVQSTTTREIGESDESFFERLRISIRTLIAPYGYNHHVTLHCRDQRGNDELTNDEYQNISRKLWFISDNSPNHAERVKALSLLADMNKNI
ncbi:MAG: hypothetical protein ABIG35_04495 [Pseudomonadota bacterium]